VGVLDGKVAIVTGAGQGVGHGIALALANAGAAIVAAGRTLDKCERTAEEIRGSGGRAIAVRCDVTELEQIERCVATAVDTFAGIDILVNNAMAPHPPEPLLAHDEAQIAILWESGPLATLRFMRTCHPHLRSSDRHPGGVIINLGARSGIKPDPAGYGVYGAVKEAIRTLGRAAACEWAGDGIRVYTIVPLATNPGLERARDERPEHVEALESEAPMRRLGDPVRDVGPVAVFLCSDDAGYMTGITVPVDGGASHLG
jgi:NAD(P)-dependent dehydrogenase (short-subunit alcohol dehydrogenase family)